MVDSVFHYPGGKNKMAPWIISHFPRHECYAEVFCGSAAVLVNKPESRVEVLNDLDGDIVQFFEVLRNRDDELREWLRNVPYAKDVYDDWAADFYDGIRPDDPVERAGRFYFLRYSQFSGRYDRKAGFASARTKDRAGQFHRSVSGLSAFSDRFRNVQIENRDFEVFLSRFDGDRTFFYCDPPYVEEGDALYSHDGAFDHERFVDALLGTDAKWCVSYIDLPPGLEEYRVVEREEAQHMPKKPSKSTRTERLVMNYGDDEPRHSVTGSAGEVSW